MTTPSNPVVRSYSEVSVLEAALGFNLRDFLNRDFDGTLQGTDENPTRIAFALDEADGAPVGWIRFHPNRMLIHRNLESGTTRMAPGALIEFPVTETFDSEIWTALFEYAFEYLFNIGASWQGVYLPPDCHRHASFLERWGFERLAECDTSHFLRTLGYDDTCTLYMRRCPAARGFRRPNLYPALSLVGLLQTADPTTAPEPTRDFWSEAITYSGYSGYPWLSNVLALVLEKPASLLSIPCATGDVFRLLPRPLLDRLERGVGVDITSRNLDFARARLTNPLVDLMNMTLTRGFTRAATAPSAAAEAVIQRFAEHFNRKLAPDELHEYGLQMRAAFDEVARGGAITDWFVLLKGLGRLVRCSPMRDVFTLADDGDGSGFSDCAALGSLMRQGELQRILNDLRLADDLVAEFERAEGVRAAVNRGAIDLVAADMFALELHHQFDAIFVWEALLMVVGVGRESDFLAVLDRHLKPGGSLVLTGIRTQPGAHGRELDVVRPLLTEAGFRTAVTGVQPTPATWAPHLERPHFPALIAQKAS